jgi:two-component system response regulator AtoC
VNAPVRVLLVDDKENMLKLLARVLADGYALDLAQDGARALSLVATRDYDVVVTDLRMPGADGFEVLGAVKARSPATEVVMMTGYANVADAVRAMKQGAFDYLEKPFDPDLAAGVVARAAARKRAADEAASSAPAGAGEPAAFHNLVGRSAPMREVYDLLERAARVDATVLLVGETGTGKELAARAIHYHSARRERRFVPVNCGALPPDLVESELFGHARGAFTGATSARAGLFEEARGGTILLDEVGELPAPAQVKLLRALQEKEIRRVGESTPVKVDVRVVAATHRDLREEARAGRFREDLFWRLNVLPIRLPPLRERAGDVGLLAAHLLEKHARALRRPLDGFEPEATSRLEAHGWPGNVRELENAVERAVALAPGPRIRAEDLPAEIGAPGAAPGAPASGELASLPYREVVDRERDRASREYLVALMTELGGNVTRAAERAGMERETLHRLLRRHGLRSDDFKRGGS